MYVCLHMGMCMWVQEPRGHKRTRDPLEPELQVGCVLPNTVGCWELNWVPLQKQCALSTADPPPQPLRAPSYHAGVVKQRTGELGACSSVTQPLPSMTRLWGGSPVSQKWDRQSEKPHRLNKSPWFCVRQKPGAGSHRCDCSIHPGLRL